MQPQGTALVNAAYFNSLADQINAINECAVLQEVVNEVFASLQAEVTAIEDQIAALLPLITIPHTLDEVITWITNFIAPQARAYANYATQVTQLIAAIANLTTAIENAAARIGSCSITVPTITV